MVYGESYVVYDLLYLQFSFVLIKLLLMFVILSKVIFQ